MKLQRAGWSVPLVLCMLFALATMVFAFIQKGRHQAAWAVKHSREQSALEAALAGIAAAEERLEKGRWYAVDDLKASHGEFGLLVDAETGASAQVVCQDLYSRFQIKNGVYSTSRGDVKIETANDFFHTLHSVAVFSRGICGSSEQYVFARYLVSPEPLAFGGSMEGLRILTDGRKDEYPCDDLVSATWKGGIPGAERIFITLPTMFNGAGSNLKKPEKWRYQTSLSEGDLFEKGRELYSASKGAQSTSVKASAPGKVIKLASPAGSGYPGEPVMVIQNQNYFESSGHTLKLMTGLMLVPQSETGTRNLADSSGCRSIVLDYVRSILSAKLKKTGALLEANVELSPGPLTDAEAKAILSEGNQNMSVQSFILEFLPHFRPAGLSIADQLDFEDNAFVILDKAPPSPFEPSQDEKLIHLKYHGSWPNENTDDKMLFNQPGAIGKMLEQLRPSLSTGDLRSFIRSATVLPRSTYIWKCKFIGSSGGIDTTWDIPPGGEWINCSGQYFLILERNNPSWADNAFDLEYQGKRIRMSEVAALLAKMIVDEGEMPPESGPEFPLISDVKVSYPN